MTNKKQRFEQGRTIASSLFLACYAALLLLNHFPGDPTVIAIPLIAMGTISAFIGSPLFDRINIVGTAFLFVSGMAQISNAPLAKTLLFILEAILLIIFLTSWKNKTSKMGTLIGSCAIIFADALFLIEIALGCAL